MLTPLLLMFAVAAPCSDGRVAVQKGCCWPGQTWSKAKACVGAPQCPEGKRAHGLECVPDCEAGRVASADTQGHCCWPQQAWSAARGACVGVPTCPAPLRLSDEDCAVACERGTAVSADTQGHCCWPEQVWATARQRCVGAPRCPAGLVAEKEACVPKPPEPPPPPAPPEPPRAASPEPPRAAPVVPSPAAPVAAAAAPVVIQLTLPVVPPPPPLSIAAANRRPAPELAAHGGGKNHRPPWYFYGGLVAFVLGYVPCLIMPLISKDYLPNANRAAAVPLAGPLLARETISDHYLTHFGWNAITIADAVVQWLGAAGVLAGTLVAIVGRAPKPREPAVGLSLMVTPGGIGVSLAW